MILSADYHTHTKYSHGKGSVLDNALSAKEKGLMEIGISDHGFSHPAFGLNRHKLLNLRNDCINATNNTGVKVLMGIESNVTSIDGSVDLKPKYYDKFDIFLVGIHKLIIYKLGSYFSLSFPNLFFSTIAKKDVPKSLIKTNTKTLINVIKKNPVDIITHLNYCTYADAFEVAKAAADYGTYIELNSKKVHLTDEEIQKVLSTGVRFVIDSDAHTKNRVGEISLVEKMIKRLDFPLDRIDNIDGKLPSFRFRNFKEKNL